MEILKLLASNSYYIYNKDIAKNISIESAVLLGLLCSRYNYYQNTNQLLNKDSKQWFYCTRETIFDETGMKESTQRTAEKPLKELQIIELDKKGIPSKNYYYINEQKLLETLENFSSVKNKEQEIIKTNDNTLENQSQLITNNSNKLNNKNITNINISNNENLENSPKTENDTNNILTKSKKEKKLTKKQENAIECKKILDEFIKDEDEQLQKVLKDYIEVRKTKGLNPVQLKLILEEFEKAYSNKPLNVILEHVKKATARGWLALVYDDNFKGTLKSSYSSKPTFDNTKDHEIKIHHISDEEFDKLTHEEKLLEMEKFEAVADMTIKQRAFYYEYCLAKDENGDLCKF